MIQSENSAIPNAINGIPINETSKAALLESAKWGMFLAILSFTFSAILVILMAHSFTVSDTEMDASFDTLMVAIIWIGMLAIFIVPAVFQWLFSTNIRAALKSKDPERFSLAITFLKSLYKFLGIWFITIVAILFLFIVIVRIGLI